MRIYYIINDIIMNIISILRRDRKVIGLDEKQIHSGIRMTFSGYETRDELDYLCSNLKRCVEILRQLNK